MRISQLEKSIRDNPILSGWTEAERKRYFRLFDKLLRQSDLERQPADSKGASSDNNKNEDQGGKIA
jgi:hypothetical protein